MPDSSQIFFIFVFKFNKKINAILNIIMLIGEYFFQIIDVLLLNI